MSVPLQKPAKPSRVNGPRLRGARFWAWVLGALTSSLPVLL